MGKEQKEQKMSLRWSEPGTFFREGEAERPEHRKVKGIERGKQQTERNGEEQHLV